MLLWFLIEIRRSINLYLIILFEPLTIDEFHIKKKKNSIDCSILIEMIKMLCIKIVIFCVFSFVFILK